MAKVSSQVRLILAASLALALGVGTGSASAQGQAPSCVSSIPPGLTGPALAAAKASAAQADTGRSQLPAGAHVVSCNTNAQTLAVPPGADVQPASDTRAHVPRGVTNDGSYGLGFIACGMTGYGYWVSTPTYIHVQLWWHCTAFYASMSGAFVMETPTHGSWAHVFKDYDNSAGYGSTEFTYVPWFGYANRDFWEYGYFCFTGVGCLSVYTSYAFI
jgi:hypothetical protein